jgi:hypothetical protein
VTASVDGPDLVNPAKVLGSVGFQAGRSAGIDLAEGLSWFSTRWLTWSFAAAVSATSISRSAVQIGLCFLTRRGRTGPRASECYWT